MTPHIVIREAFVKSFDEGTQTGRFHYLNKQTDYTLHSGEYCDGTTEAAWRWFYSGWSHAEPKWLDATTAPPDVRAAAVVFGKGRFVTAATRVNGDWISDDFEISGEVTHWIPLPDPPR